MTVAEADRGEARERFPTGIVGLDEVMAGGLIRGHSYLVGGLPGTGKTVLGNHVAYSHARVGGDVLYVTLLTESHDELLANLGDFAFYDPELVGERIHYLSLYDPLDRDGLSETIGALRRLVREHQASLLVVDGAGLLQNFASSELEYRRFVHNLQIHLRAFGCTTLLLINQGPGDLHPAATYVDGIVALEDRRVGQRDLRFVHVAKLRGSGYVRGRHAFEITPAGIEVYPRLEAAALPPPPVGKHRVSLGFGVSELDAMLHGGLQSASITAVLGAPGAGKTTLGLHFVAEGARRGERGLIVSFLDPPERLIAKADAVGLDLGGRVGAGLVRIAWSPPIEALPDAWARAVLEVVDAHRPARLFLDSLLEVERLLGFDSGRIPAYLAALGHHLRARGVTVVIAAESAAVVGPEVAVPAYSVVIENALLLRYVELRSQLHRSISVIKARDSDFDGTIREFTITERGIRLAATFDGAEAVLTGLPRTLPKTPAPPTSESRE